MKIPKPTKRTAGKPLAFWAICPACWRLLSLDDGVWPLHLWDPRFSESTCYMSTKRHDSLETKR